MIQSTDDEILAENLNKAPTNVNTNISTNYTNNLNENDLPDFSTAGNYEFEYPYDDKEKSDLIKLENRINTLESDIAERENLMSGIESQMNSLNDLNEYKKLQKQLQKENKKYLKDVKLWAELNKELITKQYEMGDTHYFDLQNTNANISEVSYSLKYVSDDQLNESLALFEVIITYSAKQADEAFIESYQKA
ncbi:MAG: hypothetical protein C0596_13550 [Marinilabiliales bacterium]|nr:MAG: hypothetical protein C0596_13550 [Marinilabiliales bacterium]